MMPLDIRMPSIGSHQTEERLQIGVALFFVGSIAASQLALGGGNNETALGLSIFYPLVSALCLFPNRVRDFNYLINLSLIATIFAVMILVFIIELNNSLSGMFSTTQLHSSWLLVDNTPRFSVDNSRTLIEIIKLSSIGSVFLAGFSIGLYRRGFSVFISAANIALAIIGTWSLVIFAISPTSLMGFGEKLLFLDRLTGPYLSANTAGTFFATGVVLGLGQMLSRFRATIAEIRDPGGIDRFFSRCTPATLSLLVCGLALLLTASRSAIFSTIVAVLLLILAEGISSGWKVRSLFGIAACSILFLLGAAFLIGGGAGIQRFGMVAGDFLIRKHIYAAHWAVIRSSPIFGFGEGTFDEVNKNILIDNVKHYADLWNVRAMHNVYLQWLEGAGLMAAIPMFSCIFLIILKISRGALIRGGDSTYLYSIVALSIVILMHGLTDFALEDLSVAAWWAALLGLGYARALSAIRGDKLAVFRTSLRRENF